MPDTDPRWREQLGINQRLTQQASVGEERWRAQLRHNDGVTRMATEVVEHRRTFRQIFDRLNPLETRVSRNTKSAWTHMRFCTSSTVDTSSICRTRALPPTVG